MKKKSKMKKDIKINKNLKNTFSIKGKSKEEFKLKGSKNNNFVLIGSCGSGKSYFLAAYMTDLLMNNEIVRIIDVGGSYRNLVKILGGKNIEITYNSSINFFSTINILEDNTISNKEIKFITEIISLMGENTSIEVEDEIREATIKTIQKYGRSSSLKDFLRVLRSIATKKSELTILNLEKYTDLNGKYYNLFNTENNIISKNDFTVYELEEIDHDHKLKEIITGIILNMSENDFNKNTDKKSTIFFDEFWSMQHSTHLPKKFNDFKIKNSSLGMVVQSISDIRNFTDFYNNAENKINLRQVRRNDEDDELKLQIEELKNMDLNTIIIEKKEEIKIFKYKVKKALHWALTHHPKDMAIITNLMEVEGLSEKKARLKQGSL